MREQPRHPRKIGRAVPGLDVDTMMAGLNSAEVTKQLAAAKSLADQLKVDGTPTFFLNRKGKAPTQVPVSQLAPSEFTSAIDAALGNG